MPSPEPPPPAEAALAVYDASWRTGQAGRAYPEPLPGCEPCMWCHGGAVMYPEPRTNGDDPLILAPNAWFNPLPPADSARVVEWYLSSDPVPFRTGPGGGRGLLVLDFEARAGSTGARQWGLIDKTLDFIADVRRRAPGVRLGMYGTWLMPEMCIPEYFLAYERGTLPADYRAQVDEQVRQTRRVMDALDVHCPSLYVSTPDALAAEVAGWAVVKRVMRKIWSPRPWHPFVNPYYQSGPRAGEPIDAAGVARIIAALRGGVADDGVVLWGEVPKRVAAPWVAGLTAR